MNIITQRFAIVSAATLLSLLCGCAAVVEHVDAPHSQMTVKQARKSLVEALNDLMETQPVQNVKFNQQAVTYTATAPDGKSRDRSVVFAEMTNLTVETYPAGAMGPTSITYVRSNGKRLDLGNEGLFEAFFETEAAARKFVDAVLVLKEAAKGPNVDEGTDFALFTDEARVWLATSPKPTMSDEARTYKVLAEDAFKRNDIRAALDAYREALKLYPMWPAGHYNAALLAAETEDYELAAHYMRRYLVLSPNAKDAAAAKDKLLLWQHKAKE
jgi:tetratricopeptide (TPR) repeat protein